MTDLPPRYRDYLTGSGEAAPTGAPDPAFEESAVVMKLRDGSWHAVLQGPTAVLEEFVGTRQNAIDWARRRSSRCWVYSEELGDVELLDE
jgi:hypothetical protein